MLFLLILRMDHRGGCGFEENTGDGAGILIAIPDGFFRIEAKKLNLDLPVKGSYAVGNIFYLNLLIKDNSVKT